MKIKIGDAKDFKNIQDKKMTISDNNKITRDYTRKKRHPYTQ